MKTTLIEQDLIIIKTINDLILKNRDESDKTITRLKTEKLIMIHTPILWMK